MKFTAFCCAKLGVTYIFVVRHNQFYLANITLRATRSRHPPPSSGNEVYNLKPKQTCVKSTYEFVRCHKFYICHNNGWILKDLLFLTIFFFYIIRLFTAKHISGKGIKMDTEENRVSPLVEGILLKIRTRKLVTHRRLAHCTDV